MPLSQLVNHSLPSILAIIWNGVMWSNNDKKKKKIINLKKRAVHKQMPREPQWSEAMF